LRKRIASGRISLKTQEEGEEMTASKQILDRVCEAVIEFQKNNGRGVLIQGGFVLQPHTASIGMLLG
jgi:hypothetical protein